MTGHRQHVVLGPLQEARRDAADQQVDQPMPCTRSQNDQVVAVLPAMRLQQQSRVAFPEEEANLVAHGGRQRRFGEEGICLQLRLLHACICVERTRWQCVEYVQAGFGEARARPFQRLLGGQGEIAGDHQIRIGPACPLPHGEHRERRTADERLACRAQNHASHAFAARDTDHDHLAALLGGHREQARDEVAALDAYVDRHVVAGRIRTHAPFGFSLIRFELPPLREAVAFRVHNRDDHQARMPLASKKNRPVERAVGVAAEVGREEDVGDSRGRGALRDHHPHCAVTRATGGS